MALPLRAMRRALATLVVAAGLTAAGTWWLQRASGPEPPLPTDLSAADPEVRALVHEAIESVRANRRDGVRWAHLGMVYEANGLIGAASACYREAVRLDSSQPRWWYRLALIAARQGDPDGAIAGMRRAIDLHGGYAPAHWRLALWLLDKGDTRQSEAAFTRATELDPSDPAGWLGLVRALLQRRDAQGAVDVLERLLSSGRLRSDASAQYARHLLGTAYLQLGRLEEARAALASSAAGDPPWRDPWADEIIRYRRGFAARVREAVERYSAGQIDRAIALLEDLRHERPRDTLLLNHLGTAYTAAGKTDQGIEALSAALAADLDDVKTNVNLAAAWLQKSDFDRALHHVDRALARQPGLARGHEVRALILWRMGRYDAAIDAFRAATKYDPRNLRALVSIGMILGQRRRFDEALGAFHEALRQDPTLAEAFLGIGLVSMDRGALGDAESALGRAAELKPADPQLHHAQERLRRLQASAK
jgi:tetratricopeptide (TPR) repeat protein